jgi:hypothetical protein
MFAIVLVLRGLSNFLKPVTGSVGFVFFGVELHGTANAVLSPLFGIYMLITGWAIWTGHRLAAALTLGYALYVVVSIPLYNIINPIPGGLGHWMFTAAMIGLPWGAVWLQRRALASSFEKGEGSHARVRRPADV